jgi:hypothetical protein
MTIFTFTDLKNSTLNWLARTTDSELSAAMDDLVALSESRIYYGSGAVGSPFYAPPLRARINEKVANLTIDQQTVALPSDFLSLRRMYLEAAPYDLQYMPIDDFWRLGARSYTGSPRFYTIEEDSISFYPSPDASHVGKLNYYFIPTALSLANPTNKVFAKFPNLYLHSTLFEAASFINDIEGEQRWHAKYFATCEGIMNQSVADRFGATPLTVKAG